VKWLGYPDSENIWEKRKEIDLSAGIGIGRVSVATPQARTFIEVQLYCQTE
jgi:hypothetical protein